MIRIAVDAMGGDHAPSNIVDGAIAAARHLDIQISLVGAPAPIGEALSRHGHWRDLPVNIVEAPDVIEMADALFSAQGAFIDRVEREIAAATVAQDS